MTDADDVMAIARTTASKTIFDMMTSTPLWTGKTVGRYRIK